jgi:hypothetical protein
MAVQASSAPAAARWSRSYPPLALLAVAVLIAAFVLPSSLNLPQSNPSTVLEYAPVPPEDDQPPDVQGNLSSVGLGSSNTLGVGGQPPPPPPAAKKKVSGDKPGKLCYGSNPPRQTEDPMAPPCVPFFEGDNFGATYQGVTKDEITVLVYWDRGGYCGDQARCEPSPNAGYYDIAAAPKRPCNPRDQMSATCDNVLVRVTRALARYFNERFQTYDRTVHFIAYFTDAATDAARRADAQDNWDKLKPFAVLDQATFYGHNQAYVDAMSSRGVLVFSSQAILPNSQYRKNAPLLWGFWPDVEHWASIYTSYVCTRVAYPGAKAIHTGNPPQTGEYYNKPRRFGVMYTTDEGQPGLKLFAKLVMEGIAKCGVDPVKGTYPKEGYVVDATDPGVDQAEDVSKFRSAGVTTVLWLGGVESHFTKEADAQKYYPEIVFAGDNDVDGNGPSRRQVQTVWQNAWGTQFYIRLDRLEDSPGYKAFRAAAPGETTDYAGRFARDFYRDHFNLFQGIQAAGPNLTPETVDQGFHAYPPKESTDPYTAAFFFDPGDYSGMKDAMEVWWDPVGRSEGSTVESGGDPGCMRLNRAGARFLAGRWPAPDETVFKDDPPAPCTAYGGSVKTRT